jgi:hypothetical protein
VAGPSDLWVTPWTNSTVESFCSTWDIHHPLSMKSPVHRDLYVPIFRLPEAFCWTTILHSNSSLHGRFSGTPPEYSCYMMNERQKTQEIDGSSYLFILFEEGSNSFKDIINTCCCIYLEEVSKVNKTK